MKVIFFTLGSVQVASSRVRVLQYLRLLRQKGIVCRVIFYTHSSQSRAIISGGKAKIFKKIPWKLYSLISIIRVLLLARSYDIVFVQKVTLAKFTLMLLRIVNSNIIFDFDDGIHLSKDISYILKMAKAVVVGNNELLNYASRFNQKAYKIPTPVFVNSAEIARERKREEVVIGWAGSPQTSGHLEPLREILLQLKKEYANLRVQLIGAFNGLEGYGFEVMKWDLSLESRRIRNFDIGIMPLPNNEMTRCKCGYKLLQYMAVGKPTVASPVGANCEIVSDGVNGFLANSPEDWKKKLSILIEDEELRKRLGAQGRKRAHDTYSYQVNGEKLLGIFRHIAEVK